MKINKQVKGGFLGIKDACKQDERLDEMAVEYIENKKTSKLVNFVKENNEFRRKSLAVNNFINNFNNEFKREPTKEEIFDNLKDNIENNIISNVLNTNVLNNNN